MNQGQIFNEVSLLIDHDQSTTQLNGKLNQLSRQLFRDFPLPDKIYKFTTTSVPYYELPGDCAEDRIRCVVIDDTEYEKLTPEIQSVDYPFCSVFLGSLYINPNPVGRYAYLYYRPRHVDLISTNLDQVPTFPEDYHELLVYGLAKWVASIQRDTDMVNNFQSEYDEIERKAKRGLKKMGLRRVKETMIW
jgi:hypothetical protein